MFGTVHYGVFVETYFLNFYAINFPNLIHF